MPSKDVHEKFDKYLADRGILLSDSKYGIVHSFMDTGVYSFGANHRYVDTYHSKEGLCRWLKGKYNV